MAKKKSADGAASKSVKRASATKAKATGASEARSAAAATLRTSLETASRIDAAKQLSRERSDDATEALIDGALSADERVRQASIQAFSVQIQGRINRGKPFDLLPRFRAVTAQLAKIGADTSDPRAVRDQSAASSLLRVMMNTLQNEVESRPDVRAALRALAWDEDFGAASKSAQSVLVFRHDQESIDRVSHMLGDWEMCSAAATALFAIEPSAAIARAESQLAAARKEDRAMIAEALVRAARYYAAVEWRDLLAALAREFSSLEPDYREWATMKNVL